MLWFWNCFRATPRVREILDSLMDDGIQGGLSPDIRSWLEAGIGGEEADREVAQAKARGVKEVPFFTIQGEYGVDGAQKPQDFMGAFVKVKSVR